MAYTGSMPRTCTVCRHPEQARIDLELVAGTPQRVLAVRYGPSRAAVQRHKTEHLPLALVKATDAAQLAEADTLLDQVEDTRRRARAYEAFAAAAGDVRLALVALREGRATLELLARVTGQLNVPPQELPVVTVYDFDPNLWPDPVPPGSPAPAGNGTGGPS